MGIRNQTENVMHLSPIGAELKIGHSRNARSLWIMSNMHYMIKTAESLSL